MQPIKAFSATLSLIGAALDLISGWSVYANSVSPMMEVQRKPEFLWPAGLFLLGGGTLLAGALIQSRFGSKHMSILGMIMIFLGAVMGGIGWTMYSGMGPVMALTMIGNSSTVGLAMLLIGVLMIVNGAVMARRMRPRTMPETHHPEPAKGAIEFLSNYQFAVLHDGLAVYGNGASLE